MTTIEELKDAFAARATQAPSVADVMPTRTTVDASAGWHRSAAVVGAAVSVAAVSVTVIAVSGSSANAPDSNRALRTTVTTPSTTSSAARTRSTTQPATRLEYAFGLGQVPGYVLTQDELQPEVQIADVSTVGQQTTSIGDIRVYAPGAFDPTVARRGAPVTVGSHSGYYADIIDPDTGTTPTNGDHKPAIAWEYAPNSWAVVQGDWKSDVDQGLLSGDPEQLELAVAQAVHTTGRTPLPVAFRLTGLPATLNVENAESWNGSQAGVGLTDGGAADPQVGADSGYGNAVTVQVQRYSADIDLRKVDAQGDLHVARQGGYVLHLGRPVTVPGAQRAFQDSNATVTALYPTGVITVSYTGADPARVTPTELLTVARGVQPASNLIDPSTWFNGLTVTR